MLGTMVGPIVASAQTSGNVVGSGTITSVSSSPSKIVQIPSGTGAMISLNAPGKLQILYKGIPVLTGMDGDPYNINDAISAQFNGQFQSPLNIAYTGTATVTGTNTWQLVLSYPAYPGYTTTLEIAGTLTITPSS